MPRSPLLPLLVLVPLLPSADDEWVVDAPHGPERTFSGTYDEGTWISLDVAPDGRTIVFDHLGHLFEVPVEGGQATALTEGRSWNMFPRYSPDGTRIAFTSDRGGSNDLWVLDRASRELTNVSDMDVPVFQGTWSLDGRALYGTSLNTKVRFPVYRFDLEGERQELIPAGGRNPVGLLQESPAEDAIYFVHNDERLPRSGPRLARLDTRTGEIENVVRRPGGAAAPALSPDGSRVAYVHRDDMETVLVLHDVETETDRVLLRGLDRGRLDSTSFYGCYSNLSWDPTGEHVYLSIGGGIRAVDAANGSVREVPFELRQERPIVETARFSFEVPREEARTRSHRWSQPAGGGILFEALGDLWLLQDGERRNLTDSPDHETNPVHDAPRGRVLFASWNDEELGGVDELDLGTGERRRLTTTPSQYGSIAMSPDGASVACLRGDSAIRRGTHLEGQTGFELVLLADGEERVLAEVEGSRNRYARRPPALRFSPDGTDLYYTEFVDDALELVRIGVDGGDEHTVATFPNATRAVLSPDLAFVAFREYSRTFVAPLSFVGLERTFTGSGKGSATRVDRALDGDFTEWTADSSGLYWTRGDRHVSKSLAAVLAGEEGAEETSLSFPFPVDRPTGFLALTGARVLTMNAEHEVLEGATVLIEGDRIAAVGTDVEIPAGARVLDASGRTLVPGMFDAHGHYGSTISTLNVIEQRHYGLLANLAYGVTTMFDVYGTTQKDFWLSDMLRAGKMDGPRIWSVGDPVFLTTYRTKMHRPIESLEDALEVADFNRDHGATALKDYSDHRRKTRQQLAVASRGRGLNLVAESFANPQMNLTQLCDGFTGLEHTMGLTPLYDDVVDLFASTQIGMTPTLIVVYDGPSGEGWFHQRERLWEDGKLLRFFTQDELMRHRRPTHHFDDEYRHPSMAAEVKKLHDRGVLLQMGAHGQMMGLGAHWEVEMFVHGGFTPLEALQIATINGFRHHGLDGDLGSIEPGKLADLFVVDGNPLEDIRELRDIELVLKAGHLHAGANGERLRPEGASRPPLYFQR